jgi:plastocyanin
VRLAASLALAGGGVALVAGFGSIAEAAKPCHPRRHHRCPAYPRRLEVDENDQGLMPTPYSLRPSHNPVGAGKVEFNVYNFGQDAHTFAVIDAGGRERAFVNVPAGLPAPDVPVTVRLRPGTYTLECTLQDHARLGMRAKLTVRGP